MHSLTTEPGICTSSRVQYITWADRISTTDSSDTCQHISVHRVTTVLQFEHAGHDCDCVFTIVYYRTVENTQHSSTGVTEPGTQTLYVV